MSLRFEDVPVAILAGGLATRMRPITERIPKVLLEVAGVPFLTHQLALLRRQGLRRVTLCVGHLGEVVRDYLGDGSKFGVEAQYVFDGPKLLGTAGALKTALPKLDEKFLTLYGDSYLPIDYRAAYDAWTESGKNALMTVYPNGDRWDASNVEFENGIIRRYDKKDRTSAMRHIDYGLGMFTATAFERVPENVPYDLATLYGELLSENDLAGYLAEERFYEIGSFTGLDELNRYLTRAA